MTPQAIEQAVGLLLAARGDFRRLERFPEACTPPRLEDGYAIQEAFVEAFALPVAGYKIACTSQEAQHMLACPQPFPGRIFAPYRLESPAEISASAFHRVGIECEFGFTMARDLPARAKPYDRAEVADAVAALHPAIEIVDARWTDWLKVGAPSIIADNAANAALVLGPACREWRALDLAKHACTLFFDGREIATGHGGMALGHPLAALAWLANDLSRRGYGLKAGDAVTTGTCTGLHFAPAGTTVRVDFGAAGGAVLRVTP